MGGVVAALVGPGAAASEDEGIGAGAGSATAPAVRVHAPARTFTVAAVGDFLSEGLVNNQAAAAAPAGVRFDYEPLLRPVEPMIAGADLAICHMETPIGAPGAQVGFAGKNAYGTNNIAAAAELPGDLARVGFDRCSTASNHANDLGADGVRSTLEALDGAGLSHTGTARSAQEAVPRVFDVAGVRVGHVSFARNSNTGFPAEWWRVRQGVTAGNVIDDVAALRAAGAEVVIVSLHVYVEMQTAPTTEDRAVVRDIIAGAHPDLIIIHGPHVVQPVERGGFRQEAFAPARSSSGAWATSSPAWASPTAASTPTRAPSTACWPACASPSRRTARGRPSRGRCCCATWWAAGWSTPASPRSPTRRRRMACAPNSTRAWRAARPWSTGCTDGRVFLPWQVCRPGATRNVAHPRPEEVSS